MLERLAKERGDTDRALTLYERAVAVNPVYSHALSNMGVVLNMLGRMAEAGR